jgi:hypothetical protein
MASPKVRQFSGDFRMWEIEADRTHTPVIPEPLDTFKNQPIETNALTFSYEAGDETIIPSKRRGARYNQPIFAETLPGTTSITIQLLETPTPILARMLFGEAANADITTGSVVDASFVVTRLDAPMQLPHRYVKASPAPTVEAGATPLVAGTDYVLDGRTGTLMILSAGSVGATVDVGDSLTLNYGYETVTGTTILGGATPHKSFFIAGDMEDRVSGEQGYLETFEVKLGVDGDIDWMSAEPIQPTLTGIAIVPDGAPAPYKYTVYKGPA